MLPPVGRRSATLDAAPNCTASGAGPVVLSDVASTVGGTTPGYSLIGSLRRANKPATTITSERTIAKMGRVMKKAENLIAHLPSPRPSP